MKYQEEFRDSRKVRAIVAQIRKMTTKHWRVMEVCGGQTHSILKYGLDELVPAGLEFLHGPGCPICVTPTEVIDLALELSMRETILFCSFGDMLRVPGSKEDLLSLKARGANIQMVYSPLDAVKLAKDHPDKEVVFFAVGFETTAPANALSVLHARQLGLRNYSILVSQVLVPPAIEGLLRNPETRIDAFLAAGHVCTIMGEGDYERLVENYQIPIAITGFEPVDILEGLRSCVDMLETGKVALENQYKRSVRANGNPAAQQALKEVFEVKNQRWRGLGELSKSGLGLNEKYQEYDAARKFNLNAGHKKETGNCISGEILMGLKKPTDCPEFCNRCHPQNPLGATMVSEEGACHAYYLYKKRGAHNHEQHRMRLSI